MLGVECCGDLLRQGGVLARVLDLADRRRHLRQQLRRVVVERRADPLRRRFDHRHPVAVPGLLVEVVLALAPHVLDPADHRVVVLFDHPGVAVEPPHRVGHDHHRVAPARLGRPLDHLGRRDVGHRSLRALRVGDVEHPLRVEAGHVSQEARRMGERLGIAHPTQPLVTLRAIRRNAVDVRAKAPGDVPVDPVQQPVRALERPCGGSGGVQNPSRERVPVRRLG